jgi:hypothetical protein
MFPPDTVRTTGVSRTATGQRGALDRVTGPLKRRESRAQRRRCPVCELRRRSPRRGWCSAPARAAALDPPVRPATAAMIAEIASGSSTVAISRRRPSQRGHASTSMSNARRIRSATPSGDRPAPSSAHHSPRRTRSLPFAPRLPPGGLPEVRLPLLTRDPEFGVDTGRRTHVLPAEHNHRVDGLSATTDPRLPVARHRLPYRPINDLEGRVWILRLPHQEILQIFIVSMNARLAAIPVLAPPPPSPLAISRLHDQDYWKNAKVPEVFDLPRPLIGCRDWI